MQVITSNQNINTVKMRVGKVELIFFVCEKIIHVFITVRQYHFMALIRNKMLTKIGTCHDPDSNRHGDSRMQTLIAVIILICNDEYLVNLPCRLYLIQFVSRQTIGLHKYPYRLVLRILSVDLWSLCSGAQHHVSVLKYFLKFS